ncbi:hypothetical protein TCE0_042r14293 [Talaromyces pinophilus]|uniref:Uncharacterized protein n=1 Tax=Talaromyces pinophilus TaxID=128442 RepID=A0A6V8HHG0_TALPI|nr:hypothetical protein TCE0_042r14293 [Talaromyces pinophilus]
MLPNIESFCGYVRQDGQRGIRETPFNPHQARVFGAVTPMATEERQNSFSKEAQSGCVIFDSNRGHKSIRPRPWENGLVVERYVTLISVHVLILARVFTHSVPPTIRKTVYCDFSASEHILDTQRFHELLAESTQTPGEGEELDQHSIHLDSRTLRKAHLLSYWLGAYELQGWITAGHSQYATFINSKGQLGRAFISTYRRTARKEYKAMFEQVTPGSPERKHALTMLKLFPKAAAHSIAGVNHGNTLVMLLNGPPVT